MVAFFSKLASCCACLTDTSTVTVVGKAFVPSSFSTTSGSSTPPAVVVVMTFSGTDAALISGPDIISRGFVYEKESGAVLEELHRVAMESIDYCQTHGITDWAGIKSRVKNNISGYLFKTTKRSPMILPIIMEV